MKQEIKLRLEFSLFLLSLDLLFLASFTSFGLFFPLQVSNFRSIVVSMKCSGWVRMNGACHKNPSITRTIVCD